MSYSLVKSCAKCKKSLLVLTLKLFKERLIQYINSTITVSGLIIREHFKPIKVAGRSYCSAVCMRKPMNPLNYASLKASYRLATAGIILETDMVWHCDELGDWHLMLNRSSSDDIPAPSMAEVWRELPQEFKGGDFEVGKTINGMTFAGYYIPADYIDDFGTEVITFKNINPTDALIDLLIWTRKAKAPKAQEADHAD